MEYFNKSRNRYMVYTKTKELFGKILIKLDRYGEEGTML